MDVMLIDFIVFQAMSRSANGWRTVNWMDLTDFFFFYKKGISVICSLVVIEQFDNFCIWNVSGDFIIPVHMQISDSYQNKLYFILVHGPIINPRHF